MSPAALLLIAVLTPFLSVARAHAGPSAAVDPTAEARTDTLAPDSSAAVVLGTVADSTAALAPAPREIGDSLFTALSHAFRYQVVAAVYYRGHRFEVADPRILHEGFGYRRITSPGKIRPGTVPLPIPWTEVDTLLLRRTYATGLGAGTAVMLGILGGLYGYAAGEMSDASAGPFLAVVVGAGAAVLGFLAGGFMGGWFHYWVQAYPEVTPETRGKVNRESRGSR